MKPRIIKIINDTIIRLNKVPNSHQYQNITQQLQEIIFTLPVNIDGFIISAIHHDVILLSQNTLVPLYESVWKQFEQEISALSIELSDAQRRAAIESEEKTKQQAQKKSPQESPIEGIDFNPIEGNTVYITKDKMDLPAGSGTAHIICGVDKKTNKPVNLEVKNPDGNLEFKMSPCTEATTDFFSKAKVIAKDTSNKKLETFEQEVAPPHP